MEMLPNNIGPNDSRFALKFNHEDVVKYHGCTVLANDIIAGCVENGLPNDQCCVVHLPAPDTHRAIEMTVVYKNEMGLDWVHIAIVDICGWHFSANMEHGDSLHIEVTPETKHMCIYVTDPIGVIQPAAHFPKMGK